MEGRKEGGKQKGEEEGRAGRKNEWKGKEGKENFICQPTLGVIITTVSSKCHKRRKICPKMEMPAMHAINADLR